MITVYGSVAENNQSLIDDLQKFFEADEVIIDWNGKEEPKANGSVLAISNVKPPYTVSCNVITLSAAQKLLNS